MKIDHAGVHVVFDKMIELQYGSMPVDKVTVFPAIRRLSLRRGSDRRFVTKSSS